MGGTAKEVARLAGVSTATVSNVLNGRKNVSARTRERVLRLCGELDYQVNASCKAGKTGRNRTILFNFSDFDRQFYLKIIQGISDYVYSRDYDLMICTSRSCERFMSPAFTSGCIMLDMHCTNELLLEKARRGYPVVVLDRMLRGPFIKPLLVDNYGPMCVLVQDLVERGYREFAFLAGQDTEDTRERFLAFKTVLEKNGIRFGHENYLFGDFRTKSGYRAAKLLMISEKLPQALVCANDNMAIGAMRAFREEGVRIPEDIAVTGFDNTQMSGMLGLSTISIPNYERGYLAAQYLLGLLEGEGDFEPFKISAKVKHRSSVLPKVQTDVYTPQSVF